MAAENKKHEVILFLCEPVDPDGPREPHVYTFNTEGECYAFVRGVVESHPHGSGYSFGQRNDDGSITDEEWEEIWGEDNGI
jgi:hypothetical protein